MKAILAASVNFDSYLRFVPSESGYKQYGAGILDTMGASWVVKRNRYISSNISASETRSHTFTVSSSDTLVRVAMAFLKNSYLGNSVDHTTDTPTVYATADLDIRVYDPNGNCVGSSITSHNNVEIVEFEPKITGTYTIKVQRYDSGSRKIYYGLAWR